MCVYVNFVFLGDSVVQLALKNSIITILRKKSQLKDQCLANSNVPSDEWKCDKWYFIRSQSVIQYDIIMHTSLLFLRHDINQSVNPQRTPHTSPWQASYGASFVRIFKKIDSVITAPHCSRDCMIPKQSSCRLVNGDWIDAGPRFNIITIFQECRFPL